MAPSTLLRCLGILVLLLSGMAFAGPLVGGGDIGTVILPLAWAKSPGDEPALRASVAIRDTSTGLALVLPDELARDRFMVSISTSATGGWSSISYHAERTVEFVPSFIEMVQSTPSRGLKIAMVSSTSLASYEFEVKFDVESDEAMLFVY